MKLIEWQDDDGLEHLSWLRDGDDDPRQGVPHDPPYIDGLGLPKKTARALYNELVKRRLVTWRDETLLRRAIGEALKGVDGLDGRDDLVGRVAALYVERRVQRPLSTRFDLDHALRTANLSAEQKECIRRALTSARIETLGELENAPTRVGHICGVDIYQLVAHILAWA